MPNTRGIAGHQPEEDCGDDETAEDAAPSEKYFAVLAFDGDEIGKWVSGEKTPLFASQLADYLDGSNLQRFGSKRYFEKPEFGDFLKAQRPLSPSYHLQFSEANPATIKNRRSTLLGEKGFGLGVSGTWQFYEGPVRAKP